MPDKIKILRRLYKNFDKFCWILSKNVTVCIMTETAVEYEIWHKYIKIINSKCLYSEAAARGVLWKKVFLVILQNSLENTCEICEISKNVLFTEHLWLTA